MQAFGLAYGLPYAQNQLLRKIASLSLRARAMASSSTLPLHRLQMYGIYSEKEQVFVDSAYSQSTPCFRWAPTSAEQDIHFGFANCRAIISLLGALCIE